MMYSFICPICSSTMSLVDGYYTCNSNELHICSQSEVDRYLRGELPLTYLRHRAKIRMGKAIRGK